MADLRGQVVVIAGASSGIGQGDRPAARRRPAPAWSSPRGGPTCSSRLRRRWSAAGGEALAVPDRFHRIPRRSIAWCETALAALRRHRRLARRRRRRPLRRLRARCRPTSSGAWSRWISSPTWRARGACFRIFRAQARRAPGLRGRRLVGGRGAAGERPTSPRSARCSASPNRSARNCTRKARRSTSRTVLPESVDTPFYAHARTHLRRRRAPANPAGARAVDGGAAIVSVLAQSAPPSAPLRRHHRAAARRALVGASHHLRAHLREAARAVAAHAPAPAAAEQRQSLPPHAGGWRHPRRVDPRTAPAPAAARPAQRASGLSIAGCLW